MAMVSSTREVWISYQVVCYQDYPRFDCRVDGYPEEAQAVLIRQGWSSVWSQSLSETVICALGSFPSTDRTY